MENKNILKVLEALGDLLEQKDTEIYLKNIRLEALEEKVLKGEEEMKLTREALNQACAENRHLRDQLRLDIAPAAEWEVTQPETKGA